MEVRRDNETFYKNSQCVGVSAQGYKLKKLEIFTSIEQMRRQALS